MLWQRIASEVVPACYRIQTPDRSGLGFLIRNDTLVIVGTARSLVNGLFEHRLAIRLESLGDRTVETIPGSDYALLCVGGATAIVLRKETLRSPITAMPGRIAGSLSHIELGSTIASFAIPGDPPFEKPCYLELMVSSQVAVPPMLLCAGASLPGGDGAPAVLAQSNTLQIAGIVSSSSLPGFTLVLAMRHLLRVLASISSFSDAMTAEEGLRNAESA